MSGIDPAGDGVTGRGGAQVIPRPAGTQPGTPPPWVGRAPRRVTVADVRRAMASAGGSPAAVAWPSQWEAEPLDTPPQELPGSDLRPAAVLCVVFAEGPHNEAHVVLTRRSGRLRSHTGEVSFPGGRIDPGEQPLAAALREAQEEVGIDPGDVEIIGRLTALSTVRNPGPIHPFVGVLPSRPALRPNPAEVERAFTVPLAELFAEGVGSEELWPMPGGGQRPIHFFALMGDTVWGATARMLRDLLQRLWDSLAPA